MPVDSGPGRGAQENARQPHECAAVLQQIAAIRGAVNGLMREVIKGHLTEHIVHQGDELKREEDLDVVLKVLDSYIK